MTFLVGFNLASLVLTIVSVLWARAEVLRTADNDENWNPVPLVSIVFCFLAFLFSGVAWALTASFQ